MNENADLLQTLANNVPSAVAVILMAWLFLRERSKVTAEFQARMTEAADECHNTQNRGTEALLKHAEAMAAQATALTNQSAALQALTLAVTRCSVRDDGG